MPQLAPRRVQRHFNSIKVRLELAYHQDIDHEALFQFHKGTIRTKRLEFHPFRLINFNSIKVRLEPSEVSAWSQYDRDFNSIKVRLEL